MLRKTNFILPDWIDFENLQNSEGERFELYCDSEIGIADYIQLSKLILNGFSSEMQIGHTGFKPKWGDFCLDTWNKETNSSDYSPKGKSPETAAYLAFLAKSGIPPTYDGLCCCEDWDSFLPIILNCVFSHVAPYSINIYLPETDLFFYFHHTCSWGFYFQKLNEPVVQMLGRIKEANLEIKSPTFM